MEAFSDKWFRRVLAQCGLGPRGTESRYGTNTASYFMLSYSRSDSSYIKFGPGRYQRHILWMRRYFREPWFRQLVEFGFAPAQVPSMDVWEVDPVTHEPSHPRVVLVASWNGRSSFESCMYRHVKIYRHGFPSEKFNFVLSTEQYSKSALL